MYLLMDRDLLPPLEVCELTVMRIGVAILHAVTLMANEANYNLFRWVPSYLVHRSNSKFQQSRLPEA